MELTEIIARIQEGDTRAFGSLVHRYRDMAFGYAMTFLQQEQRAEDAVQEALVLAYTHLDRLQEPEAFGAWLRGIVRHQCFRDLRKPNRAVSWEQMEEVGSDLHDPARFAEQRMAWEQIRTAISELEPSQQEILGLHYDTGLSQQEIATRLNLTVSAVNMRMHAARKRLRRRLQVTIEFETTSHTNTGRVQEGNGALVIAQFPPGETPPIFSLLTLENRISLCVIQHLGTGRVRAITDAVHTLWIPGQEVLDTGQPFTQALEFSTARCAVEMVPTHKSDNRLLPSGIKTIEMFAPMIQGGSTSIFAEWGLGVLVLLPELLHNLDQAENRQSLFVFLPPIRDTQHWNEVTREITAGNRNISICYLPIADPMAPAIVDASLPVDTTLVLSRRLAEQAIWPCLDPFLCRSRGSGRTEAIAEIHALLQQYYVLQFGVGGEARHTLSREEWQRIDRARKALQFLTQPFHVAEPYTGMPGVIVSAEEAKSGMVAILEGRFDTVPRDAFTMVGAAPTQV